MKPCFLPHWLTDLAWWKVFSLNNLNTLLSSLPKLEPKTPPVCWAMYLNSQLERNFRLEKGKKKIWKTAKVLLCQQFRSWIPDKRAPIGKGISSLESICCWLVKLLVNLKKMYSIAVLWYLCMFLCRYKPQPSSTHDLHNRDMCQVYCYKDIGGARQ